ncbi:DUF72 domain-containing protein [Dickeya fangzhongdai]|uniref:DUF72 domain-containing protein n=1 Tax=Dickeya fangzhongdai TaxID=1778540 RepID=UPI0004F629A3|nr:DUF72 domain-containing protein [Dickeya fangzhongdai]AIR68082.1 hypothetical protein LH89_02230 [Dickeya fangzhongdai]KGT97085.1 hypothetical protein NM75_16750 [Dickeya fangzhongdai]
MYIGLPQWQHPGWNRLGLRDLADYARHFNCVEGNTTFYALPSAESVLRWRDMTHDDFRFCFKFPSVISHQAGLRHCQQQVAEFFRCLEPIHHRLGQLWLQLPSAFGPDQTDTLWQFMDALPAGGFSYGVEVRHPLFFAKGDEERQFNQGLHQRGLNRVIMDSRPVHHAAPTSEALRDAQRKKPKVPLHVVRTAEEPLIRFIGNEDPDDNLRWFMPWLAKLAEWQTHSPYLFIHTAGTASAPELAQRLWPHLSAVISGMPPCPDWPQQSLLF